MPVRRKNGIHSSIMSCRFILVTTKVNDHGCWILTRKHGWRRSNTRPDSNRCRYFQRNDQRGKQRHKCKELKFATRYCRYSLQWKHSVGRFPRSCDDLAREHLRSRAGLQVQACSIHSRFASFRYYGDVHVRSEVWRI